MTARACILFFLRAPRLGRVKTRLAASLGDEAALKLYKAFAEDMLQSLDGCGADVALWVTPGEDAAMARGWLGDVRTYHPQPGGDLGLRMAHAFRWAYAQGYASAAALGSDLPMLTPKLAKSLVRLMRSEPALVGPSLDGGYWTIGFQTGAYAPEVFRDMPWSESGLYAKTWAVMEPLQPAVLPEMRDMDTVEDLQALAASPPADAAWRTMAAIRALGIG